MKKTTTLLALLTLPSMAQVKITEVMSSSSHLPETGANGDWFEITNTGASTVNLVGYSWDDDSAQSGVQVFPSYPLPAGESAIVLNESSADAFLNDMWNLAGTKVFVRGDFASFPGFGNGGDGVYLYNNFGTQIDNFVFLSATSGVSFARFTDGSAVPGGLSADGQFGATTSNGGDIGSPGTAAILPPASPPIFIEPFNPAWVEGSNISNSLFKIAAPDPNGDNVTLTVISKPDWITITDQGNGTASLSGTPGNGDIGTGTIEMQAIDDSGEIAAVNQLYSLSIAPASSPIILNEYNGVAPDSYLNGGAVDDLDGAVDSKLGRIPGNGGAWMEFIVTGTGVANSTVDMRGWTFSITSDDQTRVLHLSDHIALATIPAGTILTFTEEATTSNTGLNLFSSLHASSYAWTNIWMHDSILIDQSTSTHPESPAIGSRNTRVTITASDNSVIYGPSGESVGTRDTDLNGTPDEFIDLGGLDVFKLEENPSVTVNPVYGSYDDGSSSTFSGPNIWSSGASTQSLNQYLSTNTPPLFGSLSSRKAIRGSFNEVISLTDPRGQSLTLAALALPDFLTMTQEPGQIRLQNNRPLTFADIGNYEVTIQADNGGGSLNLSYLVFQLEVLNPAPSVIVNEFNAVDDTNYLNGGTLAADDDGLPASADSHFGRVAGNGKDWFELVVVGDGGPGATSLTGWKIAVGTSDPGGNFTARITIELSDPATWDHVANGTILTFIDTNTAQGGLDTEINRVNQLSTSGFAWSNIYLGSAVVSGTDLTALDLNSNNTQIMITNASGTKIFGPAGEGIAPVSGVSGTEIFELENDPSPLVSSLDDSSTTVNGYDDGSSSSTFGSPNLFTPAGLIVERAQDFSNYVLTPFAFWLIEQGIPGADPSEDLDGDRASNLEEYLFGGNPTVHTNSPIVTLDPAAGSTTYDIRNDDPNYGPIGQRSINLVDWTAADLTISNAASPLGASYTRRSFTYEGAEPRMFFRIYQP
ncbi:lamin tail domain-containing protein [Akkermansiaceae bacterium]|nr:lamin tail domain-containing protein [Akkermansiaceae bacterium]